ncbi:MAG: dual specificity protein phosphatase family protein [Deltaproteobacteria bacterium]|nr:dual specificity protein phosphatase family protein [Deltaproteobacteria bacterium]
MKYLFMIALELTLCGCVVHPPVANRPYSWATPVEVEGVSNLFKVSDTLYRGDQPTGSGMQELKKLGIKTVINLRSFHSDRNEIGNTDLRQEHIFMKSWHPEREDAVRFLHLVTDPKNAPVFVHCQHGADRTGTMCAVYRIVVQGWSKKEAIREMREGGFGFHEIWNNLADWVDELDVDSLKKEIESK